MCSPESDPGRLLPRAGLRVIPHKIRRKISLRSIRFIRKLVREEGFQILHLFNSRAISNGVLAAMGLPVKVLVYRGQPGSLRRYDPISYLNCLNPRIDRIICVSEAVKTYLEKQMWWGTDKLVTVYKGHDLAWYQQPAADLSALNLPADAFKVAMVANLRAHKGLHVLIAATHYLPAEAPIHILLVGPKPDDQAVLDAVSKAAHPERIHILGYRDDAPEVAAASDIIVLPTTKREGLARAVVEAMAYGRRLSFSDSGGNAELVADGESGFVVPVNDPKALAEGIVKLWAESALRTQFGRGAQRRIRDIFNVEQGTEKTLQIYRELAGR